MPPSSAPLATRFAGAPRWLAALLVGALLLLTAYGAAVQLAPQPAAAPMAGQPGDDLALYRTVAARLRQGEPYYPVVAEELRTRGYAVKPFVNFRPPTLALLLAARPGKAAAPALLWALVIAVLAAWILRLRQMGFGPASLAAAAAVLLTGLGAYASGAAAYFHEVWAGLLVMLSLAVWRPDRWGPSVLLGLAALLFRELALVYPAAMLAAALHDGRRREAAAWGAAILVWTGALAGHAALASAQIRPDDAAHSWVAVSGWSFILSTVRWNAALALAPAWATALAAPLALLGLAAWSGPTGLRAALAAGGWIGAFLVLGRPDNHYWGLMYAPILALGLVFAWPALRDLAAAAGLPRRGALA